MVAALLLLCFLLFFVFFGEAEVEIGIFFFLLSFVVGVMV